MVEMVPNGGKWFQITDANDREPTVPFTMETTEF